MESFSNSPPINLSEGRKWYLPLTNFEATNSVYNITGESYICSFSTPGHWSSRGGADTFNKGQKLVRMRYQSDIKLHVEITKRGIHLQMRKTG